MKPLDPPTWTRRSLESALPSQRAIYLSDLHLGAGPNGPERMQSLLALLEQAPGKVEDIVLGGDIFEFWFEWRDVIPKGAFQFLSALRQTVKAGVRVHIIPGNHDFAIGRFFEDELGLVRHPEGLCLDCGGKWLFLHGDGFAPSERIQRLLRAFLRWHVPQKLWGLIHPDLGMALARAVGQGSRYLEPGPAPNIDEYEVQARHWITSLGLSGLVHGHTHRPLRTQTNQGIYVNNGDWVLYRSYVQLVPGSLRLETFTGNLS